MYCKESRGMQNNNHATRKSRLCLRYETVHGKEGSVHKKQSPPRPKSRNNLRYSKNAEIKGNFADVVKEKKCNDIGKERIGEAPL